MAYNPYAELDQQRARDAASNGITTKDLGHSAHDIWHACLDRPAPHWPSLADQGPWVEVAAVAVQVIDLPESEQADCAISAKGFAKKLYEAHAVVGGAQPNWSSLERSEQLAWNAVGRHMANAIDADAAAISLSDLEVRIVAWARPQISNGIYLV